VFDGIDAALTWHPVPATTAIASGSSNLANVQVLYKFKGVSAHAAGDPHLGRSALDAVELMNVGVQFLREHMIDAARIHYAILDTGGYSPNVVQPKASVLYLIRSPKNSQVQELYARVNKIAQGAAMMTETELEIDFVKGCSNTMVINSTLEKALYKNMQEIRRSHLHRGGKGLCRRECKRATRAPSTNMRGYGPIWRLTLTELPEELEAKLQRRPAASTTSSCPFITSNVP
jgi:amidohydrolase